MSGEGIYFTPNAKTAQGYGDNIKQSYLAIKKPFVLDEFNNKAEIADKLNISEDILSGNKEQGFHVKQPYSATFTGAIKDKGYDGVISEKRQEVVAFSPDQIIPAFGEGDINALARQIDADNMKVISNSVMQAQQPLNSTAIDLEAAAMADKIQETDVDRLARAEEEISAMVEQGLLDNEDLAALEMLNQLTPENYMSAFDAAYICMTRG
jgi:hypothetical protein